MPTFGTKEPRAQENSHGLSTSLINMINSTSDWQVQKPTHAERATYLLSKGEWSDCSFAFKDTKQKIINAHKVFLAMSSPVFARMFYGSMPEVKFPVLVEDIEPDYFYKMLLYVYTGSVNIDCFNEAVSVCYAAMKYMMPGLVKLCVDRVWDFLTPNTACLTYEFAQFSEDEELQNQCLEIISLDTTEVLSDPSFLEIKLTTLQRILDMINLSISSELQLFNALCRWANSELQRKVAAGVSATLRSVVDTALPKVRFLSLKPEDIAQKSTEFDLLTTTENYALLVNVITPEAPKMPMPPGFSTIKSERLKTIVLQGNDKYSWIQHVKTQKTNGPLTVITIHFQVAKSLKFVGLQMNPLVPAYNGGYESNRKILHFELTTVSEESFYSFYFHPLNPSSTANVMINICDLLQRNKLYMIKLTFFLALSHTQQQPIYIIPNNNSNQNAVFENKICYNFDNLPLKSIVFA